jgi:ACS family tartrate transporter-like MFS transporter
VRGTPIVGIDGFRLCDAPVWSSFVVAREWRSRRSGRSIEGNIMAAGANGEQATATALDEARLHRQAIGKVSRRLIPFLMAMFALNTIDRVNISFAALQMNHDLGLTPEMYGFAAGLLFITYTACEIPSNLLLERIGAGLWLARIMITWGLVALATAFVFDNYSLLTARGLLGVAEAGFAPGVMVYLMRWFPDVDRGRAITIYLAGNPIASVIGGPISAAILSMDGILGLPGWRWLFFLEGVPSIVVGIVALWWLTERPQQAQWLEPPEREWLAQRMAAEAATKTRTSPARFVNVFRDPATLCLTLAKFLTLIASYGITLWLPQIIKGFGNISNIEVGFLTAIPSAVSVAASIVVGRHSDKTGERIWHIAMPAFVGAAGFVLAGLAGSPLVAMIAITIAWSGLWVSNTVFWTLPTSLLAGMSAAAGLALINSVGNLGGFVGPYLTGLIRGATTNYTWAYVMFAAVLAFAGVVILIIGRIAPERGAAAAMTRGS